MNFIDYVPNVLLAISLAGLITFAVTYARNADWRKTAPGRSLMYLILAMASVLILNFVHLLTGYYAARELRITPNFSLPFRRHRRREGP